METWIVGIDLAWGERRPDGVCVLAVSGTRASVQSVRLARGDAALLAILDALPTDEPMLLAVDAPLQCANETGARASDIEMHRRFRREKCGCHPTNARVAARALRVAAGLFERGYRIARTPPGPRLPRVAVEVFPHPAIVRLCGLAERIPYKRGPVLARRSEFARLQAALLECLPRHFPALELAAEMHALLAASWHKDIEDQVDAFVCALVGYWHWLHDGQHTEFVGDDATGFVLVPAPP